MEHASLQFDKWLAEAGHRLGEVNRRTLSDRCTLRQQQGQTDNTVPIDGSTSLHSKTVITLGDSHSTSTMLPTKTTITLEALLTHSYWILTSNTLGRHVNDDDKFDCFDKVAIVPQC